jgi:hypothetical protein
MVKQGQNTGSAPVQLAPIEDSQVLSTPKSSFLTPSEPVKPVKKIQVVADSPVEVGMVKLPLGVGAGSGPAKVREEILSDKKLSFEYFRQHYTKNGESVCFRVKS